MILLPVMVALGDQTTERLQADYTQNALPIFQQKCFACHGPKPQDVEGIQDPKLKKKMSKALRRAQNTFPMGEVFPFPDSDNPKKDLMTLKKSIRNDGMPPKKLRALGMGQTLSDEEKKTLIDWIARAKKDLK